MKESYFDELLEQYDDNDLENESEIVNFFYYKNYGVLNYSQKFVSF